MQTLKKQQKTTFMTRTLLIASLACGAGAMATQPAAAQTTGEAQTTTPATSDLSRVISDATIEARIQSEYLIENVDWYNDVNVSVNDGVAELTGKTQSLLHKQQAATVTSTVRGVQQVENNIDVQQPDAVSGSELSDRVERALLINTATEAFEIQATANEEGEVTLTGEVASYAERALSYDVAASVPGVTQINNRINVDYTGDRPGSEIRQDVLNSLKFDALVDASNITVNARGQTVTLSGTVGSLAEQQRAVTNAYVGGVQLVVYDDLEIDPMRQRNNDYRALSDDAVQDAIDASLLLSPSVDSDDVTTVVYNDGRAQLSGTVGSLLAKQTAERLAKETSGVRRVDNFLRVVPDTLPDDDQIRRQISQTLVNNSTIESYEIDAEVNNGKVVLTGNVDNYLEKWEATAALSSIRGVKEIDNRIVVDQPDTWFFYDPYLYPDAAPGGDNPAPALTTGMTDGEIAEDIESQFMWSPFVDASDIDVEVSSGVATLTGEVDDFSERRAATENAFEGGAIAVDNDLLIETD